MEEGGRCLICRAPLHRRQGPVVDHCLVCNAPYLGDECLVSVEAQVYWERERKPVWPGFLGGRVCVPWESEADRLEWLRWTNG